MAASRLLIATDGLLAAPLGIGCLPQLAYRLGWRGAEFARDHSGSREYPKGRKEPFSGRRVPLEHSRAGGSFPLLLLCEQSGLTRVF